MNSMSQKAERKNKRSPKVAPSSSADPSPAHPSSSPAHPLSSTAHPSSPAPPSSSPAHPLSSTAHPGLTYDSDNEDHESHPPPQLPITHHYSFHNTLKKVHLLQEPKRFLQRIRKKQKIVSVVVTILKIWDIDTVHECFNADILVKSHWREPELDKIKTHNPDTYDMSKAWNPQLFIENTVSELKTTSNVHLEIVNGEAYGVERKRFVGKFSESLALFHFPFDIQDLTIHITSTRPTRDIRLSDDSKTGERHRILKRSFVDQQEWYLYKYIGCTIVDDHRDEIDPTFTHSYLTVTAKVARRYSFYMWNVYAITFLITCLSFVTYAVDRTLPHRLILTFTLVLTSVTYKFTLNRSLPLIQYLTYLDKYLLVCTSLITLVAMWHGLASTYDSLAMYDFYALVGFSGIFLLFNLIFLMFMYIGPFSHRRKMLQTEKVFLRDAFQTAQEKQQFEEDTHEA